MQKEQLELLERSNQEAQGDPEIQRKLEEAEVLSPTNNTGAHSCMGCIAHEKQVWSACCFARRRCFHGSLVFRRVVAATDVCCCLQAEFKKLQKREEELRHKQEEFDRALAKLEDEERDERERVEREHEKREKELEELEKKRADLSRQAEERVGCSSLQRKPLPSTLLRLWRSSWAQFFILRALRFR